MPLVSEKQLKRVAKRELRSLKMIYSRLRIVLIFFKNSCLKQMRTISIWNSKKKTSHCSKLDFTRESQTWSNTNSNHHRSQLIRRTLEKRSLQQSESRQPKLLVSNSRLKVILSNLETRKSSLYKSLRLWLILYVVWSISRRLRWITFEKRLKIWRIAQVTRIVQSKLNSFDARLIVLNKPFIVLRWKRSTWMSKNAPWKSSSLRTNSCGRI